MNDNKNPDDLEHKRYDLAFLNVLCFASSFGKQKTTLQGYVLTVHFTEEETVAQRGEVTCQRFTQPVGAEGVLEWTNPR